MKTLLVIVCALITGAVLGGFVMRAYDAREYFTFSTGSLQQLSAQMQAQACLDLALLEELEADKQDVAKSVVARQVASYYRSFHDSKYLSPETREFMQRIEESSGRLPALREALQKEHQ